MKSGIIKKLDLYITRQFLGPFLSAFFIALFVLVMQFLWVYIDEIMGKGVGAVIIVEMIAYMSVSLIPMALPIAILLASVMLFGNLAEKYELASMKSSGMSLMRIMMPLIIFSILLSGFSFYCSNNLIPVTNLKFQSRLYDIRQHQPTLALEPETFNYDFSGYTVRIGERLPDGRSIRDVMIYDNSDARSGLMKLVRADSGEMFVSGDRQNLIMRLFDGVQYQDMPEDGNSFKPFLQTHFSEYQLVFDISDFELQRTDEERFKSHRRMLTVGQLNASIDSLASQMEGLRANMLKPLLAPGTRALEDALEIEEAAVDTLAEESQSRRTEAEQVALQRAASERAAAEGGDTTQFVERGPPVEKRAIPSRQREVDLDTVKSFIDLFEAINHRGLYSRATGFLQTHGLQVNSNTQSINSLDSEWRKQIYEKHRKFAFAAVCIIFLFIGAPMGSIIKKGGFGYPLLVAILFFTAYVILFTLFDEMNDARSINSALSGWLAEIVLFPMGLFLTIQAMKDRKIFDFSDFGSPVLRLLRPFFKKR
ncbi:MAG: YjgP/YjgQ family permease [Saprospirales bacterium]|nr:MAG: YjgP/YjgQ family permease [Saprospirales bacterium]